MEIQVARLTFDRRLVKRRGDEVKFLVVHHTDGPSIQTVEVIHEYHKSRGWGGIAYHYLIYEDRIVKARPTLSVPTCVPKVNRKSLCVAFVGSFMNRPPSKEHLSLGAQFCAYLKVKWKLVYKTSLQLKRHRDLSETFCPGDAFPWEKFLEEVGKWERLRSSVILP